MPSDTLLIWVIGAAVSIGITIPFILRNDMDQVQLRGPKSQELTLPNNRLFLFAGGELPTPFLERCGVKVDTKFGER